MVVRVIEIATIEWEQLNKNDADIVIEDNGDNGDIIVCKSENDRTIKMLNYEYGADLIVIISDYHYSPDYTIFHNSKILSLKEAIAITVFQDYEFNEQYYSPSKTTHLNYELIKLLEKSNVKYTSTIIKVLGVSKFDTGHSK